MKLIKNLICLSALIFAFASCQRDYDMPPLNEPVYDGNANVTIAQLRAMAASAGVTTQNDTLRFTDSTLVLRAIVTANDKSGNIFKKIYLQDETGNIEMEVDQSNIYTDYPVGQEIYLELKGLSLSVYGGELQLGHPDSYNFRTPYVVFTSQAHKNGFPSESKINVKEVSDFSSLVEADRFALVRLSNVHFENGGKNKFAPAGNNYTSENLIDAHGNSIVVRTSNYAEFASETLPAGTGTVTAILGRFNGSWQLTIRSLDDFVGFEEGGEGEGGDEPVVSGVQFKKATEITSGKKYLIAAKVDGVSKVAQAIAANRTYGYIYADDANAQSDVITMDDESHAYTISASGSGYTLKDANGRYLYMTGTYNNFNLTEDASQEGALWTITKNADGTFKLLNQTMGKYIQWSIQYTSYGSYPDENGIMPELYEQVGGQGDGGGGGNTSSAKSLPYTEEFTSGQGDFTIEDGTLPDGLNFVWKFDSRYGMKATAFVSSNRFETESWTISPFISLAGASNATLSFQHAGRYFDGNMKDFCTVWAREEGGSWKQITIAAYPDESSWDFIDASASLAEFANKTIQIGFKYTSTTETAGTWEFKNFKVQ